MTLDAEVKTPAEVDPNTLGGYDFLGLGSGICFGKNYKDLLDFADKLPQVTDKKVFIFSTSGQTGKTSKFHQKLREELQSKGYSIVGAFNCAGFDTYGAIKIFGDVQKGHPDEEDLKRAEAFALSLKQPVDAY